LEWWRVNIYEQVPPDCYNTAEQREFAKNFIDSTNRTRQAHGLQPVVNHPLLQRVAQAHARDQATRDYWSHNTPEGLGNWQRVEAAGGPPIAAGGENSATSPDSLPVPAVIVRDFELHPGHRELLLNPDVEYIGVGVYQYAPDETYHVVQLLMKFRD
jgi:uncharacterized protein YkwD